MLAECRIMPRTMESLADFLGLAGRPPMAEGQAPISAQERPLDVRSFCRGILESEDYRQSILDRVKLGSLPPAVECRMFDYAYGKPPDRVEHTGKDGKPIETVTEVRRVVVRVRSQDDEEQQPKQQQLRPSSIH